MSDAEPLSRSDMVQLRAALRADWPIPPELRDEMTALVVDIARTSKSKRTRLSAVKTIQAALALNVKQGALDLARDKFEIAPDAEDMPTAEDAVREMAAAAERYDREHPDEAGDGPGGAGEVPGEAGEVQRDDPGEGPAGWPGE